MGQLHIFWLSSNSLLLLIDFYFSCTPQQHNYKAMNYKPALMRCFKKVTLRDGDGDAYIQRNEFPALLSNLPYFVRLYLLFASADKDPDHRVTLAEVRPLLQRMGLAKTAAEATALFKEMDANGGGVVLFDEFAAFAAQKHLSIHGQVMTEFTKA